MICQNESFTDNNKLVYADIQLPIQPSLSSFCESFKYCPSGSIARITKTARAQGVLCHSLRSDGNDFPSLLGNGLRCPGFPHYTPPQSTSLHLPSSLIFLLTTQVLIPLAVRWEGWTIPGWERREARPSPPLLPFSPVLPAPDSQAHSCNKMPKVEISDLEN